MKSTILACKKTVLLVELQTLLGKSSQTGMMNLSCNSTPQHNFYPDGRIVWMSEGTRYQSTVEEWTKLINAPKENDDDLDVYAKKKMGHNTMAHMYKEIPDKALETFSFGSVHFLLSGLPTINWILRHTLLPKSGDHNMIRGHAINMLHLFDVP